MSAATAEVGLQMVADFVIARIGGLVQKGLRPHDHASNAVTALRSLLILKRLLQNARSIARAEAFNRSNRPFAYRA